MSKAYLLGGQLAVSLAVVLVLIFLSGCWLVCALNEHGQEPGKQDLQTCTSLSFYSAAASGRSVTPIGRGKEFYVFCTQLESLPV